MSNRVLVVDDDLALAEMLTIVLAREGYTTEHCVNGADAIEHATAFEPDLVLLDVMLPGLDGVSVCRGIRRHSGVPIIMLTARNETPDVVAGLEAGADDYVVKPFQPSELLARIRARLRQTADTQPSQASIAVTIAGVHIDPVAHEVRRGDTPINLTPLEFDLLNTLAQQPERAFSREELLEKVWGYQYQADTRLVNVHVQRLRAKVELDPENPCVVLTVRGVGYRAGVRE